MIKNRLCKNFVAVAATFIVFSSCTDSNFKGNTGQPLPTENVAVQPEQEIETPTPSLDSTPIIPKLDFPEPPTLPQLALPEVPEQPTIPELEIPAVDPSINASMSVAVRGIVNMATQHQITNHGYRLQVVKDGEVLASTTLNKMGLLDGEPLDGQGVLSKPYLVRMHQPDFFHADVLSGRVSGRIQARAAMCLPSDINSSHQDIVQCQSLNGKIGHANGINTIELSDAEVELSVDSDGNPHVTVVRWSNLPSDKFGSCACANGVPCVAIGHSATSGAFLRAGTVGLDVNSPLVLDLNKNGSLDLKSAWDKDVINFDLNANGKKVKTGWVGSEDGLLAIDLNKDGMINSGSELFGEYSQKQSNTGAKTFNNGFLALAKYDTNKDHKIDNKDKVFSKLLVWTDKNQDGISQKTEISSLTSVKIKSLNLKHTKSNDYVKGNLIGLRSTYTTLDNQVHKMADVWFEIRANRSLKDVLSAQKK